MLVLMLGTVKLVLMLGIVKMLAVVVVIHGMFDAWIELAYEIITPTPRPRAVLSSAAIPSTWSPVEPRQMPEPQVSDPGGPCGCAACTDARETFWLAVSNKVGTGAK